MADRDELIKKAAEALTEHVHAEARARGSQAVSLVADWTADAVAVLDAVEPLIRADERTKIAAVIQSHYLGASTVGDVTWNSALTLAAKIAEEGGR